MAADQKKDVKDALLDWFGVGVKAQEITQLVARMSLLSKRVRRSASLHTSREQQLLELYSNRVLH